MNATTSKLSKTAIHFLLILTPFVFSTLIEELFEGAGPLNMLGVIITFILFALVFKRSFCGFMCLPGALQRIVGFLGSKAIKRRIKVPAKLDTYLRAVKYLVLLGIIALSLAKGTFLLSVSIDDVFEQYNILLPGLAWLTIAFALVTIIGSFFIDNLFCKYICIQGAIAGIAGRFSPSGIIRIEGTCINCKLCSKACPSNLEVHTMKKVTSTECFNCQKCVIACPKKGALTNSLADIKIPIVLFVAIAGAFFLSLCFFIL